MEPPKVNKEQPCSLPYPDPLGFDFRMGFSEKLACGWWSDEDQDADTKVKSYSFNEFVSYRLIFYQVICWLSKKKRGTVNRALLCPKRTLFRCSPDACLRWNAVFCLAESKWQGSDPSNATTTSKALRGLPTLDEYLTLRAVRDLTATSCIIYHIPACQTFSLTTSLRKVTEKHQQWNAWINLNM